MVSTTADVDSSDVYHGTNKLIFGIVLTVINFWLFAQTTLNDAPAMREDLQISESVINIAVSITALSPASSS
jgi:DHA2 family multidrug resistance protein-like MFS transporter